MEIRWQYTRQQVDTKLAMEIAIYPNGGVGDLRLGSTLYEVMKTLRLGEKDDGVEFKFNSGLNLVIVELKKQGINLLFDKHLQILVLIEIKLNTAGASVVKGVRFEFKNELIDKLDFKSVYNRYFGPTYKGHYEESTREYFLSYYGVTFKFNGIGSQDSSNDVLNTMSKDCNCSSIFIYQDTKNSKPFMWSSFIQNLSNLLNQAFSFDYLRDIKQFCPKVYKELESLKKREIRFVTCSTTSQVQLSFVFQKHPQNISSYELNLGKSTMQEIINIFGFPDNSILKRKSRSNSIKLKKFVDENNRVITTTSRAYVPNSLVEKQIGLIDNFDRLDVENHFENCNQEMIKIHNYFDLGFDIIYDLNETNDYSNVVSRAILHQNSIESIDFLKYEKVNIFYLKPDSAEKLSSCNYSEIKALFKLEGLPVFLDKKEYNIQEDFEPKLKETDRYFEFIDMDETVDAKNSNDGLNVLNESNQDLKFWGLTNYDSGNNAIFEKSTKTDEICTITLFEN